MSFGKNPHVAKAEAAELKARSAKDSLATEQAWREAARLWDRAAERETDEKRRLAYSEKAEFARAQADEPATDNEDTADAPRDAKAPTLLN